MLSSSHIYISILLLGLAGLPGVISQWPPWYEYEVNNTTDDVFYYDGTTKPPYQPHDDFHSVDGVILSEFGNITNVTLCIAGTEEASHSCHNRCGEMTNNITQKCSCDTACVNYGDCCYDYEVYSSCNSKNASVPSGNATNDSLVHNISWSNYLEVVETLDAVISSEQMMRVYNRNVTGRFEPGYDCITPSLTPSKSYYLVSMCPENSSKVLRDHCLNNATDSLHGLPWYGPNGVHYKNVYCAACAGIDVYDHSGENYRLEPFYGLTCTWTCEFSTSDLINNTFDLTDCMMGINCWASAFHHDVNPSPRRCDASIVDDCPVDNPQLAEACKVYTAIVEINVGTFWDEFIKFKNIHCAICHNFSVDVALGSLDCTAKPTAGVPGDDIDIPGVGKTPLSVLFDFSPNSESLQQSKYYGDKPPECPSGKAYNVHRGVCQHATCPPGAILTTWAECAFDKENIGLVVERSLGDLEPRYRRIVIELAAKNDNITDGTIIELIHDFWSKMNAVDFYTIVKYNRTKDDHYHHVVRDRGSWVKQVDIEPEEECLVNYTIGYSVTIEGLDSNNSLFNHIENWMDSMTYGVLDAMPSCQPGLTSGSSGGRVEDVLISKVTTANFPSDSHLCNASAGVAPVSYGKSSFVRQEVNYTKYIRLSFDNFHNKSSYESSSLAQESTFTGGSIYYKPWGTESGNWSRADRVVICESVPLCALVTLHEDEYTWIFDSVGNASLQVHHPRGRTVPPDEIIVSHVDGAIQVCLATPETNINPALHGHLEGQNIATITGCAISLTLLALAIITYLTFSELRNIPGKTILNLSLSLFLAQGLLLFGAGQTGTYVVCFSIALTMHFFWLAVFVWSNILAFDLGRTFGKRSQLRSADSGSSTFRHYSLYGWGFPAVLVAATVVVHSVVSVNGSKVKVYDLTTSCWIRSGYTLLVAFGAPVAVVLVLNVGYFARTVIGIRSTLRATKILKKEKDSDKDMAEIKKELRLYTLLSGSIGLTWISGFIIPYIGLPELWYLFIVLNSLQGPVIFFSFTYNRRVMTLWKKKLCCALYTPTSAASEIGDRSRISSPTSRTVSHGDFKV